MPAAFRGRTRSWRWSLFLRIGRRALLLELHRFVDLALRLLHGVLALLQLLLFDRGAGGGGACGLEAAACEQDHCNHCNELFHGHLPWLHLGRLSITRFALPIERSVVLIGTTFTSAVTPMYDLMWCWSVFPAPSLDDSTSTVR